MLKYRNTNTGDIVEMPEAADVIEEAEKQATEVAKSGTARARFEAELIGDRAAQQAIHARHILERMDESTKWERYDEKKATKAEKASAPTSKAT